MNGRIVLYYRTKPPIVLDHVQRIELCGGTILIDKEDGRVKVRTQDIIKFEFHPVG